MKIDRKAIAGVIVLAFLSTSCVLTGTALGGFTASVNNTANTIGSGTDFLTAKNGTTTQCSSVPTSTVPSTSTFPCTGNQFPTPVATTGTTAGADTLTATGTSSFTSATYRATSCGPVELLDSVSATDPFIVRYGVTFANSGPTSLSNSGSFGVDGSTGVAVDITSATGLQTFSEGIWFKTSVGQGGMIGYSTSSSNLSAGNYDRHIYLNAAGNVIFGVYAGGADTVQSPNTYKDGNWHFALATLQSNAGTLGTNAIQSLYVDGALVAATTRTVALGNGAEVDTGYFRIGQTKSSTADGWTGNGEFFGGQLSNAMIFNTVLTAGQVNSLYTATTQSAESALAITTDGAIHFWPLGDSGLQIYSGSLPVLGTTSPCANIRVTVGTASKCVYPASTTACVAAGTTNLLTALVSAGTLALTPSTVASPQTLTTTLSDDTSYTTNYDSGLHLLVPLTITESPFAQTFTWPTNAVII